MNIALKDDFDRLLRHLARLSGRRARLVLVEIAVPPEIDPATLVEMLSPRLTALMAGLPVEIEVATHSGPMQVRRAEFSKRDPDDT